MGASTKKGGGSKGRKGRKRSKPTPDPIEIENQEPMVTHEDVEIEHEESAVQSKEPLIETVESAEESFHRKVAVMNKKIWPDDKPLPKVYVKRKKMPCPSCRRVLTDSLGQCVVMTSSAKTFGYFRCKCCNHRWQLPVV